MPAILEVLAGEGWHYEEERMGESRDAVGGGVGVAENVGSVGAGVGAGSVDPEQQRNFDPSSLQS